MATLSRSGRKRVTLAQGEFYTAAHYYTDKPSEIFVNSEAGEKVQYRLSLSPAEAAHMGGLLIEMASKANAKPKKDYSKLYTLTLDGKEVGRIEGEGAGAGLCIIARHLAASGHGRPSVECVPDAQGRQPFGFLYAPSDRDVQQWKDNRHHIEMNVDGAAAEIAKWNGRTA